MHPRSFFDNDWQIPSTAPLPLSSRSDRPYTLTQEIDYSGRITARAASLVEEIANGNAVVYVGAGASIAAGLPNWRRFLHDLEKEARAYSLPAAHSISERISAGDYLVAAEMLQNIFGPRLQEIIHRVFGTASVPTPIHRAIATIPFSLAITTNYDCLLETAYHFSVPRLTWQNPYDVLQNLRSGIFCVLKLHGDYAIRKSIVLSRSHFRDLLHINHALLNSLRMLLATRTFLFVGVSFSDPDLLSLMDEARALYGDAFGPHYAVVPDENFDPVYSEVLERAYNIRTIVADGRTLPGHTCDSKTGGVATLLSHVGGLAAYAARTMPFRHGIARFFQDPSDKYHPASERLLIGWLLRSIVHRLGVSYGYVSLPDPTRSEMRVLYRMFEYSGTDDEASFTPAPNNPEPTQSVQNRLFLQGKIDEDFVLIPDLTKVDETLLDQGFEGAQYFRSQSSSRCALCVPIYVGGRRSGVVTLEAEWGFIFTKYHRAVVKHFCSQIGMARYEANRFSNSAAPLKRYADNPEGFQYSLRFSRDLADLDLQCLLYQIDPYGGQLEAELRNPEEIIRNHHRRQFVLSFEEDSLASEVFRQRRTICVPDVSKALETQEPVISPRGVELLKIEGPLAAFPVNIRGYTAGVFVGWSGGEVAHSIPRASSSGKREESKFKTKFWRGIERARRILHVLANEPVGNRDAAKAAANQLRNPKDAWQGRGAIFLNTVRNALLPIDEGISWGDRVHNVDFRRKVIDGLLATLVSEECGLLRARLFRVDVNYVGLERAVCIGSRDATGRSHPEAKEINGYLGEQIIGRDSYVEYTMRRSEFDPYARLQDQITLGGVEDPSVDRFHKVPGRPWIVAPVGPQHYDWETGVRSGMTTLGYLAADHFCWDSSAGRMRDASQEDRGESGDCEDFGFKRYCMDFISDVLSILIFYESVEGTPQPEVTVGALKSESTLASMLLPLTTDLVRQHFGDEEKWQKVTSSLLELFRNKKYGPCSLADIEHLVKMFDLQMKDVFSVLELLSEPETGLLEMQFTITEGLKRRALPKHQVIKNLRAWWRDKSLSTREWEAWARGISVEWVVTARGALAEK